MILVKNNILHHQIENATTNNIETTGIQIEMYSNQKINIYSVYIQPNKNITDGDIGTLFTNKTPTITGGDFNAKNETYLLSKKDR